MVAVSNAPDDPIARLDGATLRRSDGTELTVRAPRETLTGGLDVFVLVDAERGERRRTAGQILKNIRDGVWTPVDDGVERALWALDPFDDETADGDPDE